MYYLLTYALGFSIYKRSGDSLQQQINGRAFETGYHKTTRNDTVTGKTQSGYGKFHVLLRKENNIWKILMDEDANENITEVVFKQVNLWRNYCCDKLIMLHFIAGF